jgi:hypothetical protein
MTDSIRKAAEELYDIAQRHPAKQSAVAEFELWLAVYREHLARAQNPNSEHCPVRGAARRTFRSFQI